MPAWTLPMEGGCRCGRVRFRVTRAPLLTMACHCRGCQRMTASAFSLSAAIPDGGFAVIAGEIEIGGVHGEHLHHHHCGWCKSWLFTRFEPSMGFTNVRAPMLDDPSWVVPFVETQTEEGFAWAKTGAAHSFARFPEMDAWEPLIQEYAQRNA